jgi:signal transduction histidine kinase/ActR/RegA family two-component response regulator
VNAPADSRDRTYAELARENEKLTKIVKVLMDRVERSTDAQGNAFSLFQAAITLESTVRQRTTELQSLNRQLSAQIDERLAIESALQHAKAEAERANAGKTEFLAAASHDLLQPLNVARLFLDAIAQRPLDAEALGMLDRVGRSLESAESLLRTLLEMSRLDAGAMRAEITDVALDPLLRHLANEYGLAAEDRGLRLRVVPCDAVIRTDIRLFERILRNLIGNALRYTDRGGVLVGARRRGDRLHVDVWDTGSGIPAVSLREIFKEFKRLPHAGSDDRAPGMGLGLAIVDRIARLLGASVEVRSRVGRGSVFRVTVPMAAGAAAPPAVGMPRSERGAEAFRGRTVLIVDDDRATLDGMQTILRGWGMDAIAAHSVDDAVARSRGRRDRPAAILADYHLHDGTTGFDVIDAVRASFAGAQIPAIVITADPSESTRRRAAERGFGYLKKPLRVERLRALLAHMFAAA